MQDSSINAIQKTKVAIIGAGFGGLAMAIRLLQNNIHDFVILEKAKDVGGTWRENQYPGAACDVQSHMYSLSFAPKTNWSKRYAEAGEIFSYIQDITEQFQLREYCQFEHEVTRAEYDEGRCIWTISFKEHDPLEAQFVIFASGHYIFHKSHILKALKTFKVKCFTHQNGITITT